ncbi:MAG: glutamate 5-kinase [Leptospirales bacterium]|nr:glutamate 5-kinase [Leptospirales bacterium]
MSRTEYLKAIHNARRVVIKVGTSLLTDSTGMRETMLKTLVSEIDFLRRQKKQVMLVTSGAVGMARSVLRERALTTDLPRKQALAAIGQGRLIAQYEKAFGNVGLLTAQLLITARDLRDRRAYLNIGNTMEELIGMDVLPIINENDTVSTDELKFGDNDLLSAACSSLFGAELLIILTSAPGFLKNGERVSHLSNITPDDMQHAHGPAGPGSGGMRTKLRAGQLCLISGQMLAILPGDEPNPVQALFEGKDIGTLIAGQSKRRISARKKWLLYARPEGELRIDSGASTALIARGSSLLAAGIREIRGTFLAGDPVEVLTLDGITLGRGIVSYSERDLSHYLANPDAEKKQLHGPGAVIHRDNLILED